MTAILDELYSHRKAILARDAKTEARLATLYRATLAPVQAELDKLAAKMSQWRQEHPGQDMPASWLYEDARLHQLQLLIQQHVGQFADRSQQIVATDAHAATVSGSGDALSLLDATVPTGVDWTWGRPNPSALDALGQQPLDHLFAPMGKQASQAATAALFAGLALGRNPRDIARDVQKQVGNMTYSRASVIARTSTIRAYGAAALATYRANDDVCAGWIWVCDLGVNTCAACLALNGSVHALDEDLDDHPNGRCAKLPKTKSWDDILGPLGIDTSGIKDTRVDIPDGGDWLGDQSDETQRAVLGPGKAALFSKGELDVGDLVGYDDDPVWGRSIYEKPLRELAGAAV